MSSRLDIFSVSTSFVSIIPLASNWSGSATNAPGSSRFSLTTSRKLGNLRQISTDYSRAFTGKFISSTDRGQATSAMLLTGVAELSEKAGTRHTSELALFSDSQLKKQSNSSVSSIFPENICTDSKYATVIELFFFGPNFPFNQEGVLWSPFQKHKSILHTHFHCICFVILFPATHPFDDVSPCNFRLFRV